MMKKWLFKLAGTGAGGQTWETRGTINCDAGQAFAEAMRESFQQLTDGRAVFGLPGVGCNGPYDVVRIEIEQLKDAR
jgi:hypothetical protein